MIDALLLALFVAAQAVAPFTPLLTTGASIAVWRAANAVRRYHAGR